jgi:hypothetical protein
VREAGTGQETYMKMYSVGIGPGLGVKDFRGIFVFTDPEALESFIEEDKGDSWAGSVDVAPGIKLYQLTETGLALQATIQGTKFWKDDELS